MKESCFKSRFWKKEGFKKDCYFQFCRAQHLGIFRIPSRCAHKAINNKYVEDPRLQASGMTALWNRAFTLIELLVVVLIIGVLAAIAVPQYQRAVDKSRLATMLPVLHAVTKAQEVYYLANGTTADTFEQMDISLPADATISPSLNNTQKAEFKYFTINLSPSSKRIQGYLTLSDGSSVIIFRTGNFSDSQLNTCEAVPNTHADKICQSLPGSQQLMDAGDKHQYKIN